MLEKANNPTPVVEYFETGCICILEGRLSKVSPEKTKDEQEDYYINNCSCSRNFKLLLGN